MPQSVSGMVIYSVTVPGTNGSKENIFLSHAYPEISFNTRRPRAPLLSLSVRPSVCHTCGQRGHQSGRATKRLGRYNVFCTSSIWLQKPTPRSGRMSSISKMIPSGNFLFKINLLLHFKLNK